MTFAMRTALSTNRMQVSHVIIQSWQTFETCALSDGDNEAKISYFRVEVLYLLHSLQKLLLNSLKETSTLNMDF